MCWLLHTAPRALHARARVIVQTNDSEAHTKARKTNKDSEMKLGDVANRTADIERRPILASIMQRRLTMDGRARFTGSRTGPKCLYGN